MYRVLITITSSTFHRHGYKGTATTVTCYIYRPTLVTIT